MCVWDVWTADLLEKIWLAYLAAELCLYVICWYVCERWGAKSSRRLEFRAFGRLFDRRFPFCVLTRQNSHVNIWSVSHQISISDRWGMHWTQMRKFGECFVLHGLIASECFTHVDKKPFQRIFIPYHIQSGIIIQQSVHNHSPRAFEYSRTYADTQSDSRIYVCFCLMWAHTHTCK